MRHSAQSYSRKPYAAKETILSITSTIRCWESDTTGKVTIRDYREGDEEAWLSVVNESLKDCPGYETMILPDFLRWKNSMQFDKDLFFA